MFSEDAARSLEVKGISLEVIDLRTILLGDQQLVFKSMQKANRALVVHDDTITMGFGAETSAGIMEQAFESLDVPVGREAATCPPKLQRRRKDSFCLYARLLENGLLPAEETGHRSGESTGELVVVFTE